MNSWPSRIAIGTADRSAASPIAIVVLGFLSATHANGRYTPIIACDTGCSLSCRIFPRMNNVISAGASVIDTSAANAIENVLV